MRAERVETRRAAVGVRFMWPVTPIRIESFLSTTAQAAREVTELNALRSIRRKPVVAGMISEYHYAT
ncbi:hypothetical protein [Nonomuraea sp. 10N515B]|uniref:hypothetical protein n=1 Tax=Nonomuraea sp. 10N515B TaxID=3457422 RepID=UPI003FCCF474